MPVPTPVYIPLPEELLRTCEARYLYPADSMPVRSLDDKVEALEIALAMCNNDKEVIRSKQPRKP